MRTAGSGHILTVSSVGSRVGRVTDGIYCASKAAIEIAFEALRYEVARFGINVSVVCPGAFRTGIDRNFALSEAQEQSPYAALLRYRLGRVREACRGGGDPAEVAGALRRIADDPSPAFRHVIGAKAMELDQALSVADATARAELLTHFSGIDWWLAGANGSEAC
jgi:NAD(P)-dependent dehydrogenase (short-subunit alcohol dehydrogenase family)